MGMTQDQELQLLRLRVRLREVGITSNADVDYLIERLSPNEGIEQLSIFFQKLEEIKPSDAAKQLQQRRELLQIFRARKELSDIGMNPAEVDKVIRGKGLPEQKAQLDILIAQFQVLKTGSDARIAKLDAAGKAIRALDVLDENGKLDPRKLNRLTAAELAPILSNAKLDAERQTAEAQAAAQTQKLSRLFETHFAEWDTSTTPPILKKNDDGSTKWRDPTKITQDAFLNYMNDGNPSKAEASERLALSKSMSEATGYGYYPAIQKATSEKATEEAKLARAKASAETNSLGLAMVDLGITDKASLLNVVNNPYLILQLSTIKNPDGSAKYQKADITAIRQELTDMIKGPAEALISAGKVSILKERGLIPGADGKLAPGAAGAYTDREFRKEMRGLGF